MLCFFVQNGYGIYDDVNHRKIPGGSAQVHDERFKACVALQAQYIWDTFGKFPSYGGKLWMSSSHESAAYLPP
jgi:hypothetical protein